MSLTQAVALAIADRGRATVDDLAPLFPSSTRYQVKQAVKNARSVGLIQFLERGKYHGPSTYGPKNAPARPPAHTAIRCVFTMAAGGIPIPMGAGRQCSPLGPWTEG